MAQINNHLFTPGGTRRIRALGFQFCNIGEIHRGKHKEVLGLWLKEGSKVRVRRIKRDGRLLWKLKVTGRPGSTFRHPDEDEILSLLEFLADSPQAEEIARR